MHHYLFDYLFDYLFYFLKAEKEHCKVNVLGKAVSTGSALEMKVLCGLLLFAE